jgi:DNA adenine methylase
MENALEKLIVDARLAPSSPSSDEAKSPIKGTTLPFLKWAGGKRWLNPMATRLRSVPFRTYYEPFLGSGAIFFGLMPRAAVLSDTNPDLIETYQSIKDDWHAVQKKLSEHDRNHSSDYYYRIRDHAPRKPHTRAARFIYLNRTCWNALYRVNRKGQFNTPIGTKTRAVLPSDDFKKVSTLLRNVEIVLGDFEEQIDRARKGDLIFADPPYTVRHKYNGFIKYNEQLFSWSDQERLCSALARAKRRGALVICTNADHESIRELYGRNFQLTPLERYSAIAGAGGNRGSYAELLITG